MERLSVASVCGGLAGMMFTAFPAAAAPEDGNILVVAQTEVRVPQNLPGDCAVTAIVREVVGGSAFREGQTISIHVPCSGPSPVLKLLPAPVSPLPRGLDPAALRSSTLGSVHIDDDGRLNWSPSRNNYSQLGRVSGYRVLDRAKRPPPKDKIA